MSKGFTLSDAEKLRMMQDFDMTVAYDHDNFGKIISGNTDIRSLLLSADIMRRGLKHLDVVFEEELKEEDRTGLKIAVTFDFAMRVMHSIECTALLLAAYSKRSKRFHEEITRYSLDEDGLEILRKSHESRLSNGDVRHLFGFPPNGESVKAGNVEIRKAMIEKSCKLISNSLKELADFYFGNREIYRRYKHGHPFAMIHWLGEKNGEVKDIPLMLFVTQEDVESNRNKTGSIWRFGVNYWGQPTLSIDQLFDKLRLVYHLFFLAKYNCHMRTFWPGLDMSKVWIDATDLESLGV